MKKPIISVVGLGFVGLTLATVNALHGFETIGIDINKNKINALKKGIPDIFEPNLKQYLKHPQTKKNLILSTDLKKIIDSDITFVTVGTPSKKNGEIDLKFLKNAIKEISKVLKNKTKEHTIVIKSTVVPTTVSNHVKPYIKNNKIKLNVNPEFLREGSAIKDLEKPHLIVIGEEKNNSSKKLISYYNQFYKKLPEMLVTNFTTAELIKYSNNAFLATKISFINSIANICQKLKDTNVDTIAYAIGKDPRIGSSFLNAGPGFGGSCLPKDVSALLNFSENIDASNSILKAVKQTNQNQIKKIFDLLYEFRIKRESIISILGVSFKKETDDIRESVAIQVVKELLKEEFRIKVHDPLALNNFKKLFGNKISYSNTINDCLENSDCCIVLTEWNEYSKLKERDILKNMNIPNIIDTKRLLSPSKFSRCNYKAIGLGI